MKGRELELLCSDQRHAVVIEGDEQAARVHVDGADGVVALGLELLDDGRAMVSIGQRRLLVHYVRRGDQLLVHLQGKLLAIERHRPSARGRPAAGGNVAAPMPGTVSRVLVEPGQTVSAGQPLYGLEAMKMETVVKAPTAGRVVAVRVEAGAQVDGGEQVVELQVDSDRDT